MYQIHQLLIKDVEGPEEIQIVFDNLRNPKLGGWTHEQIDVLEKTGQTEREGKLGDGQMLKEIIKIVSKFEKLEIVKG